MALRGFIDVGCHKVQDDVILTRVGDLEFFEAPDSVLNSVQKPEGA